MANDPFRNAEPMEIATGRPRRLASLALYIALVAAVAGLLIWVFVRFTGSMRLATALVVFMLGYMFLMGWLATRNDERRSR